MLARGIDVLAFHHRIRPREVDILENAETVRCGHERAEAAHAVLIDDDHFTGGDVAHVIGANDVEGAGFGGEDVGVAQFAQHQRAHAVRIADADELRRREDDEGEGAFHLLHRVDQAVFHGGALRQRHEMDDDFGVRRRGEQRAALDEFFA